MSTCYTPSRGDMVWLSFDPQAGHEQSERRPAVVLSPVSYNERVGLALFCPVTNSVKGYPFEVEVPDNPDVSGVILADQIKSLDWRVRRATLIMKLTDRTVNEVLSKAGTLLRSSE